MSIVKRSISALSIQSDELGLRLAFLLGGVGATAWAPMVSIAKKRVGLGDGEMGAVLLCLGVGSVGAMLVAGRLFEIFGCRRVLGGALLTIVTVLPCLADAESVVALCVSLTLFGIGVGITDCVINIWAIEVEQGKGCPIMSGLHGHFSLGGVLSPISISLLLATHVSVCAAICVISFFMVGVLCYAVPLMPTEKRKLGRRPIAVPRGIVAFLGSLCFIVYLAEGAVFDWSGVFLVNERGADPAHAGLGYAAFSIAMTGCRLGGDWIVRKLGTRNVIAGGGMLAAAGLAVAVLGSSFETALMGFALLGVGCSNLVPVLFTAAGRQTRMPTSTAVPAMATIGYAGVLAGPSALGAIAECSSLSLSLFFVAILLIVVACSASYVSRIG